MHGARGPHRDHGVEEGEGWRGTLVNTAIVTGDVSDPDLRNNRATVKTEVR